MTLPRRAPRAFTLLETIVVVVVLGVLAAVAAYGYSSHVANAHDAAARMTLVKVSERGIASEILNGGGRAEDPGFVETGADLARPANGDATTADIDGRTVTFTLHGDSTSDAEISMMVADSTLHTGVAYRYGDLAGLAIKSQSGRCVYASLSTTGDVEAWIGTAHESCSARGALEPLGITAAFSGDGDPTNDIVFTGPALEDGPAAGGAGDASPGGDTEGDTEGDTGNAGDVTGGDAAGPDPDTATGPSGDSEVGTETPPSTGPPAAPSWIDENGNCPQSVPGAIVADKDGGVLFGTAGDDIIVGSTGADVIYGLAGNDIVCGASSQDTLYGGLGDDILAGGNGKDTVNGENGNDLLYGENGKDVVIGGAGEDRLYGGNGKDLTD